MQKIIQNLRTSQKLLQTTANLLRTRQRLLSAYSAAAEKKQASRMNYLNRRLQENNSFLTSLNQIESELTTENARPRFVVSSLFLHQCFRQLTKDQKEEFFFVSGLE